MVDSTQYTKTHELYKQFGQWLGVDSKLDSNYFMINYSLHAATKYIKAYYNIDLSLDTVFEKVSTSSVFSPSNSPTKILNVFKYDTLSYPTVTYLDSTTFKLETIQGDYDIGPDFSNSIGDFYSTYLIGYVNVDSTDYSDINFDDEYRLPTPKVFLPTGELVKSPQTVISNTLSIVISGIPTSKVLVDNVEIGVIPSSGKLEHTINLTQEVTTTKFKLIDPDDETKTSLEVKELFIVSSKTEKPFIHVLGYDTKVNTKNIRVKVATPIGTVLNVNGVEVTTTKLLSDIDVPIVTTYNSVDVIINISGTLNNVQSDTRHIKVVYDSSLNDSYVHELNKDYNYVPYLPEDLMIAVFKLANHFYNGTLYNNNNIDNFRTANDISQTYMSHSIPSDVKSLLSTYTHYTI